MAIKSNNRMIGSIPPPLGEWDSIRWGTGKLQEVLTLVVFQA
jgi:hypothetical protein